MRRFAALFAALAVLAGSWVVTSAPVSAETALPSTSGDVAGFSSGAQLLWDSSTAQARELDLMAATGAKWLRLDFPWPSVQPTATTWNWAPFDRIVSMARARGLTILGLPSYTPNWAKAPGAVGAAGPADPAMFAQFMTALVTRYRAQVQSWEIWNEPNQSWSWNPPDPAAYARLLTRAYAAVKAADPTATVVTAGLAPAPDAADGSQIAPLTYLRGIYAAGAQGSFDAVGVHPYCFPTVPTDASSSSWNYWFKLPVMHQLMVEKGDGAKKIWATEFGAPTGTGTSAVSETMQVSTVREVFIARTQWSWSGPIFWYSARDSGTDASDREQNFGLWRNDFSAKPAAAVFDAIVADVVAPTTTSTPSTTSSTTTAPPTTTTAPPTTTTVPRTKSVRPRKRTSNRW